MDDPFNVVMSNYEPIELKGKIFISGIKERMTCSIDYLFNKYKDIEKLRLAIDFVEYHLNDCIKSDVKQLQTIGFFASTEAEMELDHSIKHALIGSYKAAFADLRRAIELTLISVFLTSDLVERKKAVDWVMSKNDSPGFSKSVDQLIKQGYYKVLNDNYNWGQELKQHYWKLSDYSHNKGKLKSYRELNKTSFFSAGTSAPTIDVNTLGSFADTYILTVSEIATLLAIYNPIILVGLPLDTKLGLDTPMSGFLYDHQSEIVHRLIPDQYKEFFRNMASKDPMVIDIVNYFNNLPDLSEEDLKEQAKRHDDFFKQHEK